MTDYKALVEQLRRPHLRNPGCGGNVFSDAADAVEVLVAEREALRREVEFKKARIRGAVADYEEECARRDRAEAERDALRVDLRDTVAERDAMEEQRDNLARAYDDLRAQLDAMTTERALVPRGTCPKVRRRNRQARVGRGNPTASWTLHVHGLPASCWPVGGGDRLMDIPNEALSRYPEDYKTIGGSAMERRAFTAGAEWVRREMEARVVELEAVIRAVDDWFNDLGSQHVPNGNALAGLLEAAPPEVLTDHDREVAARAWDELYSSMFDGVPTWNANTLHDPNNPYRVADQNGGE